MKACDLYLKLPLNISLDSHQMVFKKVLAEVQLIFRTTEVKGCDIYIYITFLREPQEYYRQG